MSKASLDFLLNPVRASPSVSCNESGKIESISSDPSQFSSWTKSSQQCPSGIRPPNYSFCDVPSHIGLSHFQDPCAASFLLQLYTSEPSNVADMTWTQLSKEVSQNLGSHLPNVQSSQGKFFPDQNTSKTAHELSSLPIPQISQSDKTTKESLGAPVTGKALKQLESLFVQNRKHKRRTMKQIGVRTCFLCKTKATTRWRLGWFYLKNSSAQEKDKNTQNLPLIDEGEGLIPCELENPTPSPNGNYGLKCVDLCNPCGLAYRRRRTINSFASS